MIPYDGVFDEKGRPIPWEACITLNNDWGYSTNNDYKTASDIIRALVNCVSKGGNLLLNVGPDARGRIPKKSQTVLKEVGEWIRLNGERSYFDDRDVFFNLGKPLQWTFQVPDTRDTVIKFELQEGKK